MGYYNDQYHIRKEEKLNNEIEKQYNQAMKRSKETLDRRKQFVSDYLTNNASKQMKVIVSELCERLFISEKTVYNIVNEIKQDRLKNI